MGFVFNLGIHIDLGSSLLMFEVENIYCLMYFSVLCLFIAPLNVTATAF